MNLINQLELEHDNIRQLLDNITTELPTIQSLQEMRLVVRLIARTLERHGKTEDQMLYPALKEIAEHIGNGKDMIHQHRELDANLTQLLSIENLSQVKQEFLQVVHQIQKHFEFEETNVFPPRQTAMSFTSLAQLGTKLEAMQQSRLKALQKLPAITRAQPRD